MNEKPSRAARFWQYALPIAACLLMIALSIFVIYPRLQEFRDRGVTEAFATAQPDTTPSPDEKLYP